jgi:hypothetical protein
MLIIKNVSSSTTKFNKLNKQKYRPHESIQVLSHQNSAPAVSPAGQQRDELHKGVSNKFRRIVKQR